MGTFFRQKAEMLFHAFFTLNDDSIFDNLVL